LKAQVECAVKNERVPVGTLVLRERIRERVRARLAKFEEEIMNVVDVRLQDYARAMAVDLDLALGDRKSATSHRALFHAIASYVSAQFAQSESAIRGRCREASLAMPRHILFYLCRQITGATYAEIGGFFLRDHGTVIMSCRRVKDRCSINGTFKKLIDDMEHELRRDFGIPENGTALGGTPSATGVTPVLPEAKK
jgi:chromosomal replication initiation ATPase DnaA